ncbi:MAG: alpha/beta hydrolase fold domain-containing protein [Bryobacteraceae bacterium]
MLRWTPVMLFAAAALAQNPATPPVPDSVVFERDIDYASVAGAKLGMDIARPKAPGPHPAVVLIHGGGFRRGTRQSYTALALRLAGRGYVAAAVSYRLTPKYQFPAPVRDVKSAVRFLRANAKRFDLDPDRIGVTGSSAGGHLALMLGLTGGVASFDDEGPNPEQSSRVSCVVNYFGPTDFTRIYDKGGDAAEVLPAFLGANPRNAMKAHIEASPLQWVSPDDAPILTIHGDKDPLVPYEQAVWLTERLVAAGVPAELEMIGGAGHGFRGEHGVRAEARMMAFFDKYLKPAPSPKRVLISDHAKTRNIIALEWPSGRELWRVPNEGGHDVQSLPNGGVLLTRDRLGVVVELDANQKEVWRWGPDPSMKNTPSAQRLPNGNTLIGDNDAGKLVEVDRAGKIIWTYENPDLGRRRMRLARRTPEGTTLICVQVAGRVIEVDKAGKIVWTWQTGEIRKPYLAERLPNGNTLISIGEPGEVVEVDRAGKTVRSVGGDDRIRMAWTSGFRVLPNGGLLIADYTGRRLVEVDSKGNVVAELRDLPYMIASADAVAETFK